VQRRRTPKFYNTQLNNSIPTTIPPFFQTAFKTNTVIFSLSHSHNLRRTFPRPGAFRPALATISSGFGWFSFFSPSLSSLPFLHHLHCSPVPNRGALQARLFGIPITKWNTISAWCLMFPAGGFFLTTLDESNPHQPNSIP